MDHPLSEMLNKDTTYWRHFPF